MFYAIRSTPMAATSKTMATARQVLRVYLKRLRDALGGGWQCLCTTNPATAET